MAILQKNSKIKKSEIKIFREQLLNWYANNARTLPWRAINETTPDPYHVWLSEIMLQQTTVGAVISYYTKFLSLWPTIHDLANAPQEDILHEWAGLGYYARARNLHACAKIISTEHKGIFPTTQNALKQLPGIGDYTSAAITAIAFQIPATVVDGNIERIMARYFAQTKPLREIKKQLNHLASQFFEDDTERPGDLAQAFMDLGAGVCTPKNPKCSTCPINTSCQSCLQNLTATIPAKPAKKPKPQKIGYVYWLENNKGEILLERRNEKSMLGGMIGFPTSEWVEKGTEPPHLPEITLISPQKLPSIHHSFTHFDLELILIKQKQKTTQTQYFTHNIKDLNEIGFPTLFKKAKQLFLTS